MQWRWETRRRREARGLGAGMGWREPGRVPRLPPPVGVYDDPADTFVATFLGSPPMNLVPRDGRLEIAAGYPPEDLVFRESFRSASLHARDRLATQLAADGLGELAVVVVAKRPGVQRRAPVGRRLRRRSRRLFPLIRRCSELSASRL